MTIAVFPHSATLHPGGARAQIDINDRVQLAQLLAEMPRPVDSCIHFAGLKAVGESTQIPLLFVASQTLQWTGLVAHSYPLATQVSPE